MKHLLSIMTIMALAYPSFGQKETPTSPKVKLAEMPGYICKVSGHLGGDLPVPEFQKLAKMEITSMMIKNTKDTLSDLNYQITFLPNDGEVEYFVVSSFNFPEHVILKLMNARPGDMLTIFGISFNAGTTQMKLPSPIIFTAR
ncbi:MAG: hypothetical protein EXR21_04270 [Flavobacteriaceae bacterium]|nr:hypothetical protein [Flavobacteriaceae bacterium]